MFEQNISFEVWGGDGGKYRLMDSNGEAVETTPQETCDRISSALSDIEAPELREKYFRKFQSIMGKKFAGGGRIMANAGAGSYKKETSPINCTVMRQIPDSLSGIMDVLKDAALTLKAGCGVGYDFSTIRPKDAFVYGAGANTSGVISFMKIFDASCATIMSGGGRRGAQMGCLDISHPEIEDFIKAKRENGILRYFNLSCLITDEFMNAVENNDTWTLWFWNKDHNNNNFSNVSKDKIKIIEKDNISFSFPEYDYFQFAETHNEVEWGNCKTSDIFYKTSYKTMPAKELFDLIMVSTYSFAEPGFILIDRVNKENNLYFCESIRCTNPCGEQPLHPLTSCLLGSIILPAYIENRFSDKAYFDFDALYSDVIIASRALDNVVEINNLPLHEMQEQILMKRRHGLGITGLGSSLNMLCMKYGSKESLDLAEKISYTIAAASLKSNIELAKEKGCAPIFSTKKSRKLVVKSEYMIRLLDSLANKKDIVSDILKYGLRYSHATSIAPTGTMSLTWGNNCSNGLEPVFENKYMRNIRQHGKKTKVQEEVFDLSYFYWTKDFKDAPLPEYWSTTNNLSVSDHINMQAVIQKWCDSSISKTINVPTNYPFEDFKKVYMDGWKKGLKGITTFRFNPDVFSGVLVQQSDLASTDYIFTLDDGSEIRFNGSQTVEYDGELHNVANLFDALKEGLYGNM